ncbi:MAG: hypothetical protein M3016_04920 [Actinomycetota bacterium]|nr:hypothetical protein [Actinomycetota bacterium]
MLLDANLLLYAVHKRAEQHEQAAAWLTEQLNGSRRLGFPWAALSSRPRGRWAITGCAASQPPAD